MAWWGRKVQEKPRQPQPGRPNMSVFSYYSGDHASGNQAERGSGVGRDTHSSLFATIAGWSVFPFLVMGVIPILSLFFLFFLNTAPQISFIPENTAPYRPKTEYQAGANALLGKSILNRTKLTVDTGRFRSEFKNKFPEVTDVSITLPVVGRRPVVTLQILSPAAVLSSGTTSYVLDTSGKAVLPLNQAPSSLLEGIPMVQDESTSNIQPGKLVLTPDNLRFLNEVQRQLKAKNLSIQSMVLSRLPNELHIRLQDAPYYIKFQITGDVRGQAGTFLAVYEKLAADKVVPSEYIDVRVPEKAFYK